MPSTERAILDTHIHLWPSTAVSPTDHGWMSAGHTLARRHGISDYSNATTWSSPVVQPKAFIYLETDRYLPSPEPDIGESVPEALKTWAKAPLNELKFLRRIVEETPQSGDGFVLGGDGDGDGDGDDDDGPRMAGCVIWAPFHLSTALFNAYLEIAEQVAGPQLWAKVVGFRYLLQGKGSSAVQQLVRSEQWLANLLVLRHGRKGRGWSFDIGVDAHRDGVEVVGYVADMVERLRALENEKPTGRGVRFVLDHLCKPSITHPTTPWPYFSHYTSALARLGADSNVYMKLSGALNEFPPSGPPSSTTEIVHYLRSYLKPVLASFGRRIMFASDWPVCNVGGGEQAWGTWREVVEKWETECGGGGDDDKADLWWRAGCEAYDVEYAPEEDAKGRAGAASVTQV